MTAGATGGRPAGRTGGPRTPHPPWTADTVPADLLAIVDAAAGRVHRPGGSVAATLADILNAYDAGFRS